MIYMLLFVRSSVQVLCTVQVWGNEVIAGNRREKGGADFCRMILSDISDTGKTIEVIFDQHDKVPPLQDRRKMEEKKID